MSSSDRSFPRVGPCPVCTLVFLFDVPFPTYPLCLSVSLACVVLVCRATCFVRVPPLSHPVFSTSFLPRVSSCDSRFCNFFMACYLEEKGIRHKEEESCLPSEPEVVLPSPTHVQTKDQKSGDKGKKSNTAEKPLPSAEPPEPVLPGSLAIGSVSLAVAKTGAQVQGIPLYKYIAALKTTKAPAQFHIPIPLVTLLSCGKNSPGKLSLLEEVLLIPKAGQRVKQIITMTLELQKEMMKIINTSTKTGATQVIVCDSGAPAVSYERPEQPLELIIEACTNLGLSLGEETHLAVNCAAPELVDYSKGKYEVATGVLKSPDELVDMYQTLISKYPAVVALIDPFRKENYGHQH